MPPSPPHPPAPNDRRRAAGRTLVLAAAAVTTAALAAGCGGGEPAVVGALDGQTVTVTLAPSPTSTVPAAPQELPAAPADERSQTEAGDAAGERAGAPAQPASTTTAPRGRPVPQPTVHVTRATALRSRPGGPVIGRIAPRTEFGSPTVVAVVRQRGPWLGILTSALPNGRIGWISARARLEGHRTGWEIAVSLRRRQVVARRDGRVVSRFPVAIGGPSTPTPQGRFAVTDKLTTGDPSSPYGCCILALTGHQTKTPQGWGGGDRIAIHATNLPQTIGTEASVGCLRAPTEAIRRLVDLVPLGTIVTVRA